jgi:hypothetical protein
VERYLCAAASEVRDEPVFGTASRVDRWLLVESNGPWGPRALPQSRGLDEHLVLDLQQRAKAAHARLLLIRKPTRLAADGPREVYVADSRPDHLMLRRRLVGSDAELDGLTLPFDDADATGWQPTAALVGVCTQGRHDTCCAMRGRPVAAALLASHPDITYEISHIGGDRFAANALVLPGGHYLGRLTPAAAPAAVAAVLAGRRPAPYYRGRSTWSPPVQAAQELAAAMTEDSGLDALLPRAVSRLDAHRWQVVLARAGRPDLVVEVVQQQGPDRARLTCHALHEHAVPAWALVELRTA